MEFKAKVRGVESAFEGIIIIVEQEKMEIPVAEEPQNTDEMIIAKKIKRSMKMLGMPVETCQAKGGFKTPFWIPEEDYEDMGKPTVGDILQFRVEKVKEEEWKISKPITPLPLENLVMFTMKRLEKQTVTGEVEKTVLIQDLTRRKFAEQEIEKAVTKLLRVGLLYEPKENCLKVT